MQPPRILHGAHVLYYAARNRGQSFGVTAFYRAIPWADRPPAPSDDEQPFAGKFYLEREGERDIVYLAIGRAKEGYYVVACDKDWNVIGDTLHDSLEEAKDDALSWYDCDNSIDWIKTDFADSYSAEEREVEPREIDESEIAEPEIDRLIQEHRLLQAIAEVRRARPEMSLWEAKNYVDNRSRKLGVT
jgi:hypothetical protein